MNKKYLSFAATIVAILILGTYLYIKQSELPPQNVVREPGVGGQWVLMNELVILASGQDIELFVEEFGGEITVHVPETDTYQVKFPVSSLEELDAVADKLREKENKIQVTHAFVMRPPR